MKVRVDLGLDFEGHHTLGWQPSDASGALDVPRAMLDRWLAEREAFKVATLRWKRVIEEVEEQLYRAERERVAQEISGAQPRPQARPPKKSTILAAQLAEVSVETSTPAAARDAATVTATPARRRR